jgi:hypothetical protein
VSCSDFNIFKISDFLGLTFLSSYFLESWIFYYFFNNNFLFSYLSYVLLSELISWDGTKGEFFYPIILDKLLFLSCPIPSHGFS